MAKWNVVDSKSGAVLGVVEKYRRNCGTLKNPDWRVWYRDYNNPTVEADRRSLLAVYFAGGPNYRLEQIG